MYSIIDTIHDAFALRIHREMKRLIPTDSNWISANVHHSTGPVFTISVTLNNINVRIFFVSDQMRASCNQGSHHSAYFLHPRPAPRPGRTWCRVLAHVSSDLSKRVESETETHRRVESVFTPNKEFSAVMYTTQPVDGGREFMTEHKFCFHSRWFPPSLNQFPW